MESSADNRRLGLHSRRRWNIWKLIVIKSPLRIYYVRMSYLLDWSTLARTKEIQALLKLPLGVPEEPGISLEGLPSKYYPAPMLHNFRVQMKTGVSNSDGTYTSDAILAGLKIYFFLRLLSKAVQPS
jgi:hypothetical protein